MIEEVFKSLSWLGHDGVLYQNKKTIYFDPFQIEGGPAADIILISHDHFDHCSPDDVKKIQTQDTVTVEGVRLYHTGDADFIPEMKTIQADIAFLPVSGTYVMTANEAAEAAKVLKPKIAIPMHYGAIVGSEEDAKAFKELLKG